ncbi:DUF362 domain-containing protein [Maledivibacter halophilus]|uniref:Ferredoxin n=1 Tax=Maledivibacter halophilus TaxID=36842 RepID=A0A1T5LKP1_9FIRM|nr:DUF362 domain-containing protein [Maledivibacter halophilus]SKC76444.1 Uncharacterized conserved protein, DUF362 family [Maledivibacter halophilus]
MNNLVSKVKCTSYNLDKVENAIKLSLNQIGNIENVIKEDSKVLLKPNLVSPLPPEKAATTHPVVIEAMIRILKGIGVKEIWIGDSGVHGTPKIFSICGMNDLAKKYGCKICDFDNYYIDEIYEESNKYMKRLPLSKYITESDVIINMPKIKIHHAETYTGAIKNMYGSIVGKNKMQIHARTQTKDNFQHVLVDVLNSTKPNLCIMDAIVGMEGNGPANGKPIETNMILTSYNAVAMDIVAARQIGIDVKEVGYIEKAIKRGLGPKVQEVKEIGDKLPVITYDRPAVALKFLGRFAQKLMPVFYYLFKPVPKFDPIKCIECGICKEICPVNAIRMEKIPVVDKKLCISCFCCQEACFSDAIERSDVKKEKKKACKRGA